MIGKIDGECPECGERLRFTVDDVAAQRTVRCARGHRVQLKDEGGGARKTRAALRDLDRAIKRLGR